MRIAIFVILLLVALGYAAWKGGLPERMMVVIVSLLIMTDWLFLGDNVAEYQTVDWPHLALDLIGAITTIALVLVAYHFWPMVAAVLHVVPLLGHISRDLKYIDGAHCLSSDAGRLVLAAPAPVHPRNLAAPTATASRRQRSVLVRFLATIDPAHSERLASALLQEFRSLGRICAQTPEALERVLGKHGKHKDIAHILLGAREVILEGIQPEIGTEPVNPACSKLNQYLIASMGFLADEALRILFLDGAHRLIADEQVHRGSVRHLELYPRTIFRRAIEHGASALILVHNHPSGDPTPSESDIVTTRQLAGLGRSLDIEIVDHIVVAATGVRRITGLETETIKHTNILTDGFRSRVGEPSANRSRALDNARHAYRRRQYRRELIGTSKLFGEPAWEMLIDLFIHECEGKKLATSALCLAAAVPPSTALRRVNDLCEAGYIVKIEDPDDGRRHFVQLTADTSMRLVTYFSSDKP